MRVLVACEFSGRVRDAFIARGHDAVSCDLLPSERPGPHYQGDVLDILVTQPGYEWDLMIAHPPCTYLANSGVRWLYGGRGDVIDPDRWIAMKIAAEFFAALLMAPVPRIAIENPVMHGYGRLEVQAAAVPGGYPERGWDTIQTVQPWQFGHGEIKATQLWLKNLPRLTPTDIVDGRTPRVHHEAPSPDRWKNRSRTYQGLADAMAEQWGALLPPTEPKK